MAFGIIYGEDTFAGRKFVSEKIRTLSADFPSAGIFEFSEENFDLGRLDELIRGRPLFGGGNIVVFENCLKTEQAVSFFESRKEVMKISESFFILFERGEVKKEILEFFKKEGDFAQEFKPVKSEGSEKTATDGKNIFAICDAFAAKDRKKAWIVFNELLMSGIEPEEIFYKILWQVKNLLIIKALIATKEKDMAKEANMHPFVLGKNLRAEKNFSEQELAAHSFNLIKLFRGFRFGFEDLQIGLEKFLIGI